LGKSVLTLAEVLLTFTGESDLYTIKSNSETRTVVLTKNEVEVEGGRQVIVMVRDVTDRVRLE
jgi:hypothetical protein